MKVSLATGAKHWCCACWWQLLQAPEPSKIGILEGNLSHRLGQRAMAANLAENNLCEHDTVCHAWHGGSALCPRVCDLNEGSHRKHLRMTGSCCQPASRTWWEPELV